MCEIYKKVLGSVWGMRGRYSVIPSKPDTDVAYRQQGTEFEEQTLRA